MAESKIAELKMVAIIKFIQMELVWDRVRVEVRVFLSESERK